MTDDSVNPIEDNPRSATSLSLLERARAQDQAAWERLVSLYTPLVVYWARQMGLQEADAADIAQEVFKAVAEHIGTFQRTREGGTFRGWLRTITRHKLCDRGRPPTGATGEGGSDAYERWGQLPAPEPKDTGELALRQELRLLYRRALELLVTEFEPSSWKAFWRVVVDGQRPADVAEELKLSRNAVYLAKSRVLARLREEFQDLIEA